MCSSDLGGLRRGEHFTKTGLGPSPNPGVGHGEEVAVVVLLREERRGLRCPQPARVQHAASGGREELQVQSVESGLVDEVLEGLLKQKFSADDMLCTMVSRRVCPLQMWGHKICHMSGQLDPTRLSRHQLDRSDVMKRVKAIASFDLKEDWVWHVRPFHQTRLTPQVSRFANLTLISS